MSKPICEKVEPTPARRRFLVTGLMVPLLALLPRFKATVAAPRERRLSSLSAAELRRPHDLAG